MDAVHSFELVARADYELVANSFTIGAMAKLYRFGEFVFPHYLALVELLNDFRKVYVRSILILSFQNCRENTVYPFDYLRKTLNESNISKENMALYLRSIAILLSKPETR